MPTYQFECTACHGKVEKSLTFAAYRGQQSNPLRCECTHPLKIQLAPTTLTFGLKEGVSGGWVTKALKEKTHRTRHNQQMSSRQRDHVNPNKLVPNHNGQEGNSWAEVQSHVRAESGALAASTYDTLVANE